MLSSSTGYLSIVGGSQQICLLEIFYRAEAGNTKIKKNVIVI